MGNVQARLVDFLELQTSARPDQFIPIYEPTLGEAEEATVLDAVRSGWISSNGKYIREFEAAFAAFCGAQHGISTSNGTTALHLAIHALGIGPGDEVIVPALTFVASANAVHYTGATPIFADVDPATWTIDPAAVEALVTPRTKAIMPVHLYGHPAPMAALQAIADQHGLLLIEDAAEAHGAQIGTQRTGNLGHAAAFSFFANKIITTGEGGMVTTNDATLAARCRLLRDHAMPPAPKGHPRYWHDEVGFNYRMTNLQAAVGVAQMARIEEFIARKRALAKLYQEMLGAVPGLTLPVELSGYTNVYWMYSVLVGDGYPLTRDELILALRERNIDSRPFFHPLDTLPPYHRPLPCPTALHLSRQGLNLPSSPSLTDDQVFYIGDIVQTLGRGKSCR